MTHHSIEIRIYYEDTDAHGIVYHASYLRFAERGRTEFLRHIGHQNSDLEKDHGILFVVKHLDIEYHQPAVLDDLLRVKTTVTEIKNSSFTMDQKVFRGNERITDMHVVIVCIDKTTLRPVRLPAPVKDKLNN